MLSAPRGVLLALSALVALSGCSREAKRATATTVDTESPITFNLKVEGDLELDVEQKVPARFAMIRSTGSQTAVNVLGIRPLEAMRARNAAFVPGIAVTPYHGDGKYVVPKADPTATQSSMTSKSTVTLIWWASGVLDDPPLEFDQHLENCVIEIDDDGSEGRADCPKVSTRAGDKTVSIEIRWKAPKDIAKSTTTTSSASTTPPSAPPSSR